MSTCDNRKTNLTACNCTYDPCPRKGNCCACVTYHRAHGELPACYFSKEAEASFDRTIGHFVRENG